MRSVNTSHTSLQELQTLHSKMGVYKGAKVSILDITDKAIDLKKEDHKELNAVSLTLIGSKFDINRHLLHFYRSSGKEQQVG